MGDLELKWSLIFSLFTYLISWPRSSHSLPDNAISYSLVPTEVQRQISYYHLDTPATTQFTRVQISMHMGKRMYHADVQEETYLQQQRFLRQILRWL